MERNANDTFGSTTSGESTAGSFGSGAGSPAGSSSGSGFGTGSETSSISTTTADDASFSRGASSEAGSLGDRAKTVAGIAGDKLTDVGSQVRDKAGSLKNSLADALESGAEKLRNRGAGGGQIAGAAATGGAADMVTGDNRVAQATNQLAGGLQASADWLRNADLDGIKSGIERQVKEHPGRSLAVAVGLGYLLGKAFRSK